MTASDGRGELNRSPPSPSHGFGAALKVEDGAARACVPVLVGALRSLGLHAPVLDELAETAVLGGGRQVGVVRLAAGLL